MNSLQLDDNGDVIRDEGRAAAISDQDAMLQRVENRIKLATDEWFLDLKEGLPWREILGNKFNKSKVIREIRKTIMKDPEIKKVYQLDAEFDRADKKTHIKFTADSIYGTFTAEL